MKKIKDMIQDEIEDEVIGRLIAIKREEEFVYCVLACLSTHNESMTMMLAYLRDRGENITLSEVNRAAMNIYHYMND